MKNIYNEFRKYIVDKYLPFFIPVCLFLIISIVVNLNYKSFILKMFTLALLIIILLWLIYVLYELSRLDNFIKQLKIEATEYVNIDNLFLGTDDFISYSGSKPRKINYSDIKNLELDEINNRWIRIKYRNHPCIIIETTNGNVYSCVGSSKDSMLLLTYLHLKNENIHVNSNYLIKNIDKNSILNQLSDKDM